MAQEDPNRLTEWYEFLRRQVLIASDHFKEWLAAVREQPVLIWQTATVRYAAYVLGAVVLFRVVIGFTNMWTPAPVGVRPVATTADFHVVCSVSPCRHHFVIHRSFGFRAFPVKCPKCQQKTGMPARRCNSKTCLGRWVVPERKDDQLRCSVCGRRWALDNR